MVSTYQGKGTGLMSPGTSILAKITWCEAFKLFLRVLDIGILFMSTSYRTVLRGNQYRQNQHLQLLLMVMLHIRPWWWDVQYFLCQRVRHTLRRIEERRKYWESSQGLTILNNYPFHILKNHLHCIIEHHAFNWSKACSHKVVWTRFLKKVLSVLYIWRTEEWRRWGFQFFSTFDEL